MSFERFNYDRDKRCLPSKKTFESWFYRLMEEKEIDCQDCVFCEMCATLHTGCEEALQAFLLYGK